MTNAQRYIAQLTTKLDITEGAARFLTAERADAARNEAQPVERAHSPLNILCTLDDAGFQIRDLSGDTDYDNVCFTFPDASSCIADLAESPNARHPLDWPRQNAGWHVHCFEG